MIDETCNTSIDADSAKEYVQSKLIPQVEFVSENSDSPNIFSFASSELSQDAFLCWLLSWANPAFADIDSCLHECAIEFVRALIEKHETIAPDWIEKVEVYKQYSNIDVLCIVNDEFVILIEDKTDSTQHSGQLSRYLEFTEAQFQSHKILPIYFKTGDQSDYTEVTINGYKVFSRQDLLGLMNSGNAGAIKNAIFQDYRKYLQSISDAVNSYIAIPVQDWGWAAWDGFFIKLQEELGTGDWGYVPNASGGFRGYWWNWRPQKHCDIYIQLEESKLCFKVEVSDPNNYSDIRNFWHKEIMQNCEGCGLEVVKPKRFGSGNIMSFAVLKTDYREASADGMLDLEGTIRTLRRAENLLDAIADIAPE